MIRTQVYLTEDQARDIKLRAKRQNKPEAEVIRELVNIGFQASQSAGGESTGDALLRLAKLGEKLQLKSSPDLSSRIDDILYGNEE
jgi:SRSO17 transposase